MTLPLLRNSINLPRQEGKLRRDQLQRLQPPQHQKAPLLDLFLLPTPANPLPARPTPLLQPIVVLHARQLGHTLHILISELLLQPVKVKAQTQGKARALVPPTPILQAKARRAKKARKARRVKKVKTPKVTRAKKGNKENTPGPSWKVARVQPRVTRNNCFSPSVHPAISCFIGSSIYTFHSLLPPLSIRLPAFNRLTSTFPLHAHTLPPAARTQSVIPAHSVLCSFSLISTTCHTGLFPSSSPRPSRSFRPTRSAASSFSSVQPWLNRSFRPTRPLAASTCFPHPHHFHNHPQPRLSRSFRPTRSLAHSLLVLLSFLFSFLISLLLHHCLDPVGHSGPLGPWRPLFLFSHSPCFLFHHLPTFSPPPGLSRSFRPTRSLAASILSSTHLSLFSTFALTQSVIPAHSVSGYLSSVGSYPSPFLFLPSSSGLPTPFYLLYARDSVTGSPNPLIPFVSSFFSTRRPVAMGIQSDLRCIATNVDPKYG